ncbi:MAG: hypothetical protein ACOX9C_06735 [Kiritimatiellia bacterium]|jgi:hypothetical protein
MKRIALLSSLALVTTASTCLAWEGRHAPARVALAKACDERYAANASRYANDATRFVARGLLADKTTRTITLDAFTTGVGPGDVAEFFLITENSGHGYESLMTTFAKADDICKAIEFIGVPRGRSVNYDKYIFWPKGERLLGTAKIGEADPVPLANLMTDRQTGAPVEQTGFIYTGDRRDDADAFIGDSHGPGSIICSYNEPITVLDIPRMALQHEVYENFVVGPTFPTNVDLRVEIVLTPESRPADSPRRVLDVTLAFTTNGVAIDDAPPAPLPEVLTKLQASTQAARDVHATVTWADDLPLMQIRDTCRVLKILDSDGGVRLEPPVQGNPYYKAFVPNESWRTRAQRPTQPCELRIDNDGATTLVVIEEIWKEGEIDPELKISEIKDVKPAALPALMNEKKPNLAVLLVFAPGNLRYADIKPYLAAVIPTHPNLYVFVE